MVHTLRTAAFIVSHLDGEFMSTISQVQVNSGLCTCSYRGLHGVVVVNGNQCLEGTREALSAIIGLGGSSKGHLVIGKRDATHSSRGLIGCPRQREACHGKAAQRISDEMGCLTCCWIKHGKVSLPIVVQVVEIEFACGKIKTGRSHVVNPLDITFDVGIELSASTCLFVELIQRTVISNIIDAVLSRHHGEWEGLEVANNL